MNKLESFMKKNSSLMLSIASSIGLVTTTILAIKATPKAISLIEEKKKELKMAEDSADLKTIDIIKVAWKPYIPTGISMFSTLICIFGNEYLNRKTQASLISAYAILDRSYKEYIEANKELYGSDADNKVKNKLVKSNLDSNYIHNEDKKLFFEFQTMTYFESTIEEVLKAENWLNQELAASGTVTLHDFFKYLQVESPNYTKTIGWCDHGEYQEIDFYHEKMIMDDGLECIIINTDATTFM